MGENIGKPMSDKGFPSRIITSNSIIKDNLIKNE